MGKRKEKKRNKGGSKATKISLEELRSAVYDTHSRGWHEWSELWVGVSPKAGSPEWDYLVGHGPFDSLDDVQDFRSKSSKPSHKRPVVIELRQRLKSARELPEFIPALHGRLPTEARSQYHDFTVANAAAKKAFVAYRRAKRYNRVLAGVACDAVKHLKDASEKLKTNGLPSLHQIASRSTEHLIVVGDIDLEQDARGSYQRELAQGLSPWIGSPLRGRARNKRRWVKGYDKSRKALLKRWRERGLLVWQRWDVCIVADRESGAGPVGAP